MHLSRVQITLEVEVSAIVTTMLSSGHSDSLQFFEMIAQRVVVTSFVLSGSEFWDEVAKDEEKSDSAATEVAIEDKTEFAVVEEEELDVSGDALEGVSTIEERGVEKVEE